MTLTTVDEFVQRVADGYYLTEAWQCEYRTAGVHLNTIGISGGQRNLKYVVPSMPSGVTSFILMRSDVGGQGGYMIYAKAIDMGSLDISSNAFTDGNAMPTVTELGVSSQVAGAIWAEVETALNATPGTLTVTYKDQDGNAAEAAPAFSMGASVPVRSGTFVPLNTSDYGATDITTAARTAGTTPSGVIRFWGLIPIGQMLMANNFWTCSQNYLGIDLNPVRLAAGDTLLALQIQSFPVHAVQGWLTFVGDT